MVVRYVSDIGLSPSLGVLQSLYSDKSSYLRYSETRLLTIVLLYDVISTDNCAFKHLNLRLVNIVSSGSQMGLMIVMLLIHTCMTL
jgi:hypothetical protein